MSADSRAGTTVPAPPTGETGSPYPPSPVISLEWVGPETRREDLDGDDWPVTWAADDHLYAAYGDGWGARPIVRETKANTGLVRLSGTAPDFRGQELTIPWFGGGAESPNFKGCGLLAAGGVLYHFLRYQQDTDRATGRRAQIACTLIWSADGGQHWENTRPYRPGAGPEGLFFDQPDHAFHSPTFLQAGREYGEAQDGYVYLYSPRQNRRRANNSLIWPVSPWATSPGGRPTSSSRALTARGPVGRATRGSERLHSATRRTLTPGTSSTTRAWGATSWRPAQGTSRPVRSRASPASWPSSTPRTPGAPGHWSATTPAGAAARAVTCATTPACRRSGSPRTG